MFSEHPITHGDLEIFSKIVFDIKKIKEINLGFELTPRILVSALETKYRGILSMVFGIIGQVESDKHYWLIIKETGCVIDVMPLFVLTDHNSPILVSGKSPFYFMYKKRNGNNLSSQSELVFKVIQIISTTN